MLLASWTPVPGAHLCTGAISNGCVVPNTIPRYFVWFLGVENLIREHGKATKRDALMSGRTELI